MADTPVSSSAVPRSLLERQRIAHRSRRLEAIRRELRAEALSRRPWPAVEPLAPRITGARRLAGRARTEGERRALLGRLAERFAHPEAAGIDWDVLRDAERPAWPAP